MTVAAKLVCVEAEPFVAEARIVLAENALYDLEQLEIYIAEHDGQTCAHIVIDRISRSIRNIALMPRIGRRTKRFEPGTRCFSKRPWNIYYDIHPDGEGIDVLRVVDQRRNLKALFGEKP